MKAKIKAALQQKYANLGLEEEVFEGVASAVETFVTEDSMSNFVDGAESILKKYQSMGDKARSAKQDADKRIAALQAKLDEAIASQEKGNEGEGNHGDDVSTLIKNAIKESLGSLQQEIETLKTQRTAETAFETAKAKFFANKYAGKFTSEAEDAWAIAVELNEAKGRSMSADELETKALDIFGKSVARRGADITKPFEGDGDSGQKGTTDWSSERKRKQEQGMLGKD